MKLNPYPEYKDSGVPWLGKIPKQWEVRRNSRLFAQRNQTGFAALPILEVSLRTGVRVRDFENSVRKQIMTDRDKYKRAVKGDLAYNMMRMWQGAVGVAPVDGLVSPAYVVARPLPETETRYFNYLFHTHVYMNEVDKYSRGIVKDRNRLYWEEFKQMPSAFPPTDEQKAIADFLDWNARMTRRLASAKRRLIGLLNEQKQAIIHEAVTRGLDANVRLKPSGIDRLGDVPEHWEVKKLKWFAEFNPSKADAMKTLSPNDKVVFLPMERVGTDGEIDACEYRHVAEIGQGFTYFRRHDVVIAKITPCFENGKGAYLGSLPTEHGFGTTEFIVLRANHKIAPEYLYLLTTLKMLRTIGADNMSGAAGQQRVPVEFLRQFILPVPPLSEQRSILVSLSCETKQLTNVINRAQREIDLLREYRTRLIADVVTGKLDVRGVELPAFDEAEAVDDLDSGADAALEEIDDPEETTDADTW